MLDIPRLLRWTIMSDLHEIRQRPKDLFADGHDCSVTVLREALDAEFLTFHITLDQHSLRLALLPRPLEDRLDRRDCARGVRTKLDETAIAAVDGLHNARQTDFVHGLGCLAIALDHLIGNRQLRPACEH